MESRLYVGNLTDDVSIEELRQRFAECGDVTDVTLATDRASGRFRGHAFVTMGTPNEAQAAIKKLNGASFDDRRLRVNLAGERDGEKTKAVLAAKITSQFRERANIAYELDCAGIALVVKMFPEDGKEQTWRVEAQVKGREDVVTASAKTRSAAFDEVSKLWNQATAPLDWVAIKEALSTVRAV